MSYCAQEIKFKKSTGFAKCLFCALGQGDSGGRTDFCPHGTHSLVGMASFVVTVGETQYGEESGKKSKKMQSGPLWPCSLTGD